MLAPARFPAELLTGSPFVAYSYAYPHKTAYRRLAPAPLLRDVWREERREALFLYFHVPFCEVRCGFCNLFTLAQPEGDLPTAYLAAVRRQAEVTRAAVPDAQFARLAIGGGTPTFLTAGELAELFRIADEVMGVQPRGAPTSVEASPATVSAEKLALLHEAGVERLSLGVQSFHDPDAHAMGRPQRRGEVERALQLIRDAGFPTLNLDLIYGAEGETLATWLGSLREALRWRPEEIYLYPLYVRPLTGLGKLAHAWDDQRLAAYRAGRELLLEAGYSQVSFRMFRAGHAPLEAGPVYCCQSDGMIGLGCGARSYTREWHYSMEYGVQSTAVAAILREYVQRHDQSFAQAEHGYRLDEEDQRRRHMILSLLPCEGMARRDYLDRFGGDVLEDFPELNALTTLGLATFDEARIRLTPAGIERSDAIGPWLYSAKVKGLMENYTWR